MIHFVVLQLATDGVNVRNSHSHSRSRDMTATQGVAPPPFDNAMAQAYMQMVQCPMEGVTRFFWTCSGYVRSTIQTTHWWMTSQRKSWFLYVLLWIFKKQKGLSISMTSVFQDVAGTFSKGFNTTKASVAPIFQLRVSIRWLVIHPPKTNGWNFWNLKKRLLGNGTTSTKLQTTNFLGFKMLVFCWMDRAAEADVPWITSCTVPLKFGLWMPFGPLLVTPDDAGHRVTSFQD